MICSDKQIQYLEQIEPHANCFAQLLAAGVDENSQIH